MYVLIETSVYVYVSVFIFRKKVYFQPPNSYISLVLVIKLQKQVSLAIQQSKLFEFTHQVVRINALNFLFTI
jgi:hypothetical protein